jgi:hypothetical protein
MSKEVATKQPFAVDRPAYLPNSTRGSENVGVDDLTIPRIDLIQALSPQRKKNDPAYIEGAEEGMLFNSVTSELYGDHVTFVPVYFRKEWVVWRDRNKGGGFRGAFGSEADAQAECLKVGAADHEVMDTAQHFGLIIKDDGSVDEAVISMSRSKMKVSRKLNTMIRMAGGDSFARAYRVESAEDKGEKGEYFNLRITPIGYVSEEVFLRAEALYDAIAKGEKDVNREYETVVENSSADNF